MNSTSVQLGFFDAILDLLLVDPVFLLGVIIIGIIWIVLFRKNQTLPKIRISIFSWHSITTYVSCCPEL